VASGDGGHYGSLEPGRGWGHRTTVGERVGAGGPAGAVGRYVSISVRDHLQVLGTQTRLC
jgi:hypothetical protein